MMTFGTNGHKWRALTHGSHRFDFSESKEARPRSICWLRFYKRFVFSVCENSLVKTLRRLTMHLITVVA